MFRPVVTSTAPVNAIVTNALYQPQQTFVAQNSLPKIGAKATAFGANAQPKILNIVAPQKQTLTTTSTIQNTNTVQHIKTENSVSHPIIHNGTNIINTTSIATVAATAANQIFSKTNQTTTNTTTTTSAIRTEAIKSEAIVNSASSIDSKAATTNTNIQTSTNNTITTTHVNDTISKETYENTPPPNRTTRNDQPADKNATATTINDNNDDETEPEPEIDIVINNVVCSFSVRCHLNLREIALNGRNVEFRRENGMVTMKLRRPYTTASIWSSGRITCTGATSEDQVNENNLYTNTHTKSIT